MSGLTGWLWGTSQLDDAVDKATSELLPAGADDIALNLEICDQIRSKSVPAKDAMRALKRRLNHKNPNVQNLALALTDTCVKNGGDLFLAEVASREFMDNLVSILKIPALNIDVKNNILRMIQNWNFAFETKPSLAYVGQVYKTLVNEGFKFPPKDLAIANSAMVDTQTAPEWIDSDVCLRCRNPFTFTNRKHHCRNCGQVFDQACSSKSMPLPHFGIAQDVRVCDSCYTKITRKAEKADNKGHRHSHSVPAARHRSARELADEELQRAIQLSLEEAAAGSSGHARPGYVPYQPPSWQYSEPPIVDRAARPAAAPARSSAVEEEDDLDLKAAIEASLREMNAPKPSAPAGLETPRMESSSAPAGYFASAPAPALPSVPPIPTYDLDPLESDAILTFSQTVEQVEAQGGRDISRYPAVNELYDKANSLRPKLALSLDDAGRKEQMLSEMHDKLSQAVKLYDNLLTEQIAHPRWRASTTSPPHTNPAVNGYSQWAASTSASTYQAPSPQSQTQWSPPPIQHQQYAQSPPLQQHQQQYASILTQPVQSPPMEPQRRHSYEHQQVYQQPAQTSMPPVSLAAQQFHYAPVAQVHSPPPPPLQQQQAETVGLSRAKTVSFAPAAHPPQTLVSTGTPGHLGRSNTVGARHGHSHSWAPHPQPQHPFQHQHQQHLQQQQQQQQQLAQQLMQAPAPPTNVIPVQEFPAVPTEVPNQQQYAVPVGVGMYGAGPPVEERKEALLIDL